jgi:NitT/TauT family transport system substrate-binding protein
MSMRHDRRTFLRNAIGAASAGLAIPLLAACAPQVPPAQPQPQSSAPASPKNITKISYAYATPNGLHFVATVAAEKPELAHNFGIELDLLTTTNSPNAINALVGGSVNICAATPDSGWPAQDKAPEVRQLIATADGTPYVLIGQPEIKRAADLKGKTLGVSALTGGADTTAIRVMMFENGLTEKDYTTVQSGAIADRTAAMKAKSIDALAQLEPQATILRDAGFPEIDNANNYPPLKGIHSIVLYSTRGWYESNSELAVNLIRMWDAVTKWIYDPANKADVLAISKKTMGANDKSAEAVYNLHVVGKSVPQNLKINEKYMQQFVENQKKAGAENMPSDPMKYVDSSLIDKALKG